jgi:nickel-dependent lactate racemase
LSYGRGSIEFKVPEEKLVGYFEPQRPPPLRDVQGELRRSLRKPRGSKPLREIAVGKQSAVVVIDDSTRSVPSAVLLDAVMEELEEAGLEKRSVTVLVATGLHRPMTDQELRQAVGRWHGRVLVENHDASNANRLSHVGVTSLGTEVFVNQTYMEADLKILTGDVEHHQFCGFGGGAKSVFPGLADAESIRWNHSRMDLAGTGPGKLDGNPVREEIDEIAKLAGVDFLLAVVLNPEHRIVSLHAGNVEQAFREACAEADRMYRVAVPTHADLVIASAGGHPKDATLYQAQKALTAAVRIGRPGGDVLLVAACLEGSGSALFEEWMEGARTPDELIERTGRSFIMGGHKAYQVAKEVKRVRVHLYSKLPPDKVRSWFMQPVVARAEAVSLIAEARTISVLPQATLTLAEVKPSGKPEYRGYGI